MHYKLKPNKQAVKFPQMQLPIEGLHGTQHADEAKESTSMQQRYRELHSTQLRKSQVEIARVQLVGGTHFWRNHEWPEGAWDGVGPDGDVKEFLVGGVVHFRAAPENEFDRLAVRPIVDLCEEGIEPLEMLWLPAGQFEDGVHGVAEIITWVPGGFDSIYGLIEYVWVDRKEFYPFVTIWAVMPNGWEDQEIWRGKPDGWAQKEFYDLCMSVRGTLNNAWGNRVIRSNYQLVQWVPGEDPEDPESLPRRSRFGYPAAVKGSEV